jgi:hypothetical protein
MRMVILVHLRPDASPTRVAEFEDVVAGLPDDISAVRRVHLGRHHPGAVAAGDYTWDALIDGGDARGLLLAPSLRALLEAGDVVERLDPVAFESQRVAIAEPDISSGIKRTLLLRVRPETSKEVVARFERDILGMPDHIHDIRNWAFNHTDPALCPTIWTHVWEQEYVDQSGFDTGYMMHPYHWGLVDGWFDPECPQRIVDLHFAHALCPASTTILGWK